MRWCVDGAFGAANARRFVQIRLERHSAPRLSPIVGLSPPTPPLSRCAERPADLIRRLGERATLRTSHAHRRIGLTPVDGVEQATQPPVGRVVLHAVVPELLHVDHGGASR